VQCDYRVTSASTCCRWLHRPACRDQHGQPEVRRRACASTATPQKETEALVLRLAHLERRWFGTLVLGLRDTPRRPAQQGSRARRPRAVDHQPRVRDGTLAGMDQQGARSIVEEMLRRQQAGDDTFLDDLVAVNMVNHAAGPQGRSGLAWILRTIDHDLGPVTLEQHHLIGNGDIVAQHLTLHGTHRASTMPLLADVPPSGRPMAWTFIHIWRVADGMIVEHWACRDDMGLLEQVRG
jgi:predicted ester cyclase